MVISYRRFGTPSVPIQNSWTQRTGSIGCPETSVRNHRHSLHNNQEERSCNALRGESLKSRILTNYARTKVRRSRYSSSLRGGRSDDRISVGAEIFHPCPDRISGLCNAHRISFPGVKWPGRGVYHPPPSMAEVEEGVELYLYRRHMPSLQVIASTLSFNCVWRPAASK